MEISLIERKDVIGGTLVGNNSGYPACFGACGRGNAMRRYNTGTIHMLTVNTTADARARS
jgi:hypothetical protein